MRALLLFCVLLFSAVVAAQPDNWRLHKTDGATKVEYRHNKAKLLEVRAQTEVRASAAAFLRLLEDTANITAWAANTEKAELLAQPDANTHLVHTYFSAIWPVSKRDMVTQSVWSQDGDGVLTLLITDMGETIPPVKGYVRMQQVTGVWTLTPLANGKMHLQYQGQADPAGKLPRFIGDKVALKSLLSTFTQLRQVLPDYQL